VGDLIYSDYYLQISTALPTSNIYGFGERAYKLNLGPDGTYSLLTKDNSGTEDGTSGNNAYGYHPVYLQREKSNQFHMNLLRSSTPMDVQIKSGKTLTYKVVGGIFDFNFFVGEENDSSPETVVKQYHQYLGGWILQPFWSFGYHQCRYGYKSIEELNNVLSNFSAYSLPLDVIWSDIFYMDKYTDFTIDVHNYPPDQMRAMLAEYQKRWVPIIDAGIALNNSVHTMGLNNNVYLKDPNGTYLQGQVWPGLVNYPDFYNPNTSLFWDIGLNDLYQQVPFSGIWLDMNEVSNFVDGETGFINDRKNLLNNPPFKPAKAKEFIYSKTTRMDAVHYGGIPELYLHNTFGMVEGKATYNFLKTINDLVFILSRSTFYGSGKYTAHWTGDNYSDYNYLALSIPEILNFNFFGIPMSGADICGFGGDTTEELCSRWFQLGVLYPFVRDHSALGTKSQEPYALGPTVLQTSRINLALRYSIVRYYYSLFLQQNGTGTIFRPLFFEFPEDQALYDLSLDYTDSQFLIGKGIMAAPVLTQGVNTRSIYFPPEETWFDFVTGEIIQQSGLVANYPAPLNWTAPLFMRAGHIVPFQNVTNANRTDDLDNLYAFAIAFETTDTPDVYQAEGILAGIANFDDGNVLVKCRSDNCLYNVTAFITLKENSYDLTVSFKALGSAQNYENIGITRLDMIGEWSYAIGEKKWRRFGSYEDIEIEEEEIVREGGPSNIIRYFFATPFNVQPGSVIQVSHNFAAVETIDY